MFDVFFPDRYVASTYVIDFEELYEKGFRGLIFDIDKIGRASCRERV